MGDQTENKQSMEQLAKRYRELDRKKTTAEANLQTAQKQLEELQKEAREKYGTADLQELKTKLKEMEAKRSQRGFLDRAQRAQ